MRFFLSLCLIILDLAAASQTVSNYDTCRTPLYYQHIGNGQAHMSIAKTRSVKDQGILSAGYIVSASDTQALLIKQDKNGQVLWQKNYGTSNFDEQLKDYRELKNQDLLVTGVARNKLSQQSILFFSKLSSAGEIIWQKGYENIAAGGNIYNAKVYPDVNNNIFFAAESDSSIIYGMINPEGNINWQRTLRTKPGTKLVAVTSYAGSQLIATNSIDSGYKVANFYYNRYYRPGNPTQIEWSYKLGGPTTNSHYILHDYEQYTQYSYFSGIRSEGTNPYQLVRINVNQGSIMQSIETVTTLGLIPDSLSRTTINAYGDLISFTTSPRSDKLHMIQLGQSYDAVTTVRRSATYQLTDSITLAATAKTWDAGYSFMGIKNFLGGTKIVQLKADSVLLPPSCISSQQRDFSVTRLFVPLLSANHSYSNIHSLSAYNFTITAAGNGIDTTVFCRQIKCPILPVSDSCLSSFQKLYRTYDQFAGSSGVVTISDRIFISGHNVITDYETSTQNSFIAEINQDGQVINQKKFVVGERNYSRIYKTRDNHLLLFGYSIDSVAYTSVFIAKADMDLNLIWIKSLRATNTNNFANELGLGAVVEGSDGSIFFNYKDVTGFFPAAQQRQFLTKIDPAGNVIWTKRYLLTDPGYLNFVETSQLELHNGHVYMSCRNGYNSYSAFMILKIDENSGSLVWAKKYTNQQLNMRTDRLMSFFNNQLYLGGTIRNDNGVVDVYPFIMKLDTDGHLVSSVVMKTNVLYSPSTLNFTQYSNGDIHFYGRDWTPSGMYHINGKLDKDFNIKLSKKRPITQYVSSIAAALDSRQQMFEVGSYETSYAPQGIMLVNKYDSSGNLGICSSDTMFYTLQTNTPIIEQNLTVPVSDSGIVLRIPIHSVQQQYLATSQLLCASVPGCNFLKVTGNDTICNRNASYTFIANRNMGCLAPVQWIFNTSNVQLTNQSDSSIELRFLNPGVFLLKARMVSNCTPFIDSLWIHVLNEAPLLNLGNDTMLCPNASLLLNAKKGFKSYSWQNGSTDSTFLVTLAGLYYVTVTDSCNNSFTDSIEVTVSGSGTTLDLGTDTSFCSSSAVKLNAGPGFESYLWQNGSTAETFITTTAGIYHVTVTDICGNYFSDTIRISNYRRAITLTLGADTVFCAAVALSLDAGTGFKKYVWQDGSNGQQFTAATTGLFYVQVTDSCGDVYADSILISPDTFLPFDLGNDIAICRADTATLQAPAGFSNYTWWPLNNAIVSSPRVLTAFPVNTTYYYVTAIKPNGCQVKDSVLINVNMQTIINLGADTKLCSGDSLQLNAGTGFINYVWSTGAQGNAIIHVKSAGLYYVVATDVNNCRSSDSVRITGIIPLPVTGLPKTTGICINESKQLTAAPGYNSYLWNTGTNSPGITVTTTGMYWVKVHDNFGCYKTDTVLVNTLYPSPAGFLPFKSAGICSYDEISITPTSTFQNYFWSNGSSLPTLSIQQPGIYWLKVKDQNGCTGTDTLNILSKECLVNIYFPNSFTPNKDGRNDVFKPVVFGRLVQFRLMIYNRYGQKIFETSDINNGWDGNFNRTPQNTAAFVWICNYQLAGEELQSVKGHLTLIR